jgi:hypothetical protein
MGEKSPERLALEAKAIDLGVTFQGNIGDAKLAKRVTTAETERDKNTQPIVGDEAATENGHQPQAGATEAPAINSPPESDDKDGAARTGAAPQPEPMGIVVVTGPKKGRRRIGHRFGPEPVEIPLGDLTPEQIEALKNDPALSVTWPVALQA